MPRARASSTSVKSGNGHSATRRTVIVAGVANIVVGLAKLAAGIISGSSAMLAEAAHSAADTLNQVFLLTSLRQADRVILVVRGRGGIRVVWRARVGLDHPVTRRGCRKAG